MHERQEYIWQDLVGQATHVDIWHPNAVPNPYLLPGMSPETVPPYGVIATAPQFTPEDTSRYRQKKYQDEIQESVKQLTSTIFIGEAALWQAYSEDPRGRIFTNIYLMRLALREQHSVRILRFTTPLPANSQVPFAIYTRRGEQLPVVTRDIEGKLYHSQDPQKVHHKWEILAQLATAAASELDSQELIRRAVVKQRESNNRRR